MYEQFHQKQIKKTTAQTYRYSYRYIYIVPWCFAMLTCKKIQCFLFWCLLSNIASVGFKYSWILTRLVNKAILRTERVKRLFQKTKVIIIVLLKYMKQLWINFYSFKLVLGYVRWLGARRFVYVLLLLFVSLLLYAVCSLDLAHCVLPSALFLNGRLSEKIYRI